MVCVCMCVRACVRAYVRRRVCLGVNNSKNNELMHILILLCSFSLVMVAVIMVTTVPLCKYFLTVIEKHIIHLVTVNIL